MRLFICILLLSLAASSSAQYYYDDIIAMQQSNKMYLSFKNNNIRQVSAKSFNENNQQGADFVFERQISSNASLITTVSQYSSAGKSVTSAYYKDNRLTKTIDSSDKVLTTVIYAYNNSGSIASITTFTNDAFMNSHTEEVHEWNYADNNVPAYMLRIKNRNDTTFIEFKKDENGNISEERWQKNGKTIEHYFYYYNAANLLTDVVRYNLKAARLLPDFLLDYDSKGVLIEITQILQGSSDYNTWQYVYNDNGLKKEDLFYNKQKQLIGKIEYSYQ